TSDRLYTRTSGRPGSASGDVVVVVVVRLPATGASAPSESFSDPIAWNATSRKTTPRNNNTITMARGAIPKDSRWFIPPTVSTDDPGQERRGGSGDLESLSLGRAGLLSAGPEPPEPLHQHRVGRERL